MAVGVTRNMDQYKACEPTSKRPWYPVVNGLRRSADMIQLVGLQTDYSLVPVATALAAEEWNTEKAIPACLVDMWHQMNPETTFTKTYVVGTRLLHESRYRTLSQMRRLRPDDINQTFMRIGLSGIRNNRYSNEDTLAYNNENISLILLVSADQPLHIMNMTVTDASYKTNAEKAAIGCLFIAFFIFCGVAIFLFITLCCKCSETVMGILVSVAGGFACVFAIVAFASFHKPLIDLKAVVPNVGEWLFGSIVAGVTVILTALTMAVS
ncbi:hypothetical protein CSKR_104540 [Clonorchis sinensis]|uniref:Uncharacterized protein n=1 Tax=Clonorchis sinensis TaxID=79923 RepID=A0A3R7H614_CLOSI|nr:hypothetical protein CSKR_104540 [Clonorchis sinensis]